MIQAPFHSINKMRVTIMSGNNLTDYSSASKTTTPRGGLPASRFFGPLPRPEPRLLAGDGAFAGVLVEQSTSSRFGVYLQVCVAFTPRQ